MFTIYQIFNKTNGHSYIGFTSKHPKERWDEHRKAARLGASFAFPSAIRKYGADAFVLEILEEGWCPKIGRNIREPYWIATLKPEYNETAGGDGAIGYRHTTQQNKEKSMRMMGRVVSNETRGKISRKLLGHPGHQASAEQNKLRSKKMQGIKRALGVRHTIEQNAAKSKLIGDRKMKCPHCHVVGGMIVMRRWHFNNCKGKL